MVPAFGLRFVMTFGRRSSLAPRVNPRKASLDGVKGRGLLKATLASGGSFLGWASALGLGLHLLGLQDLDGSPLEFLALVALGAAPQFAGICFVALGVSDVAFRPLSIRGVAPYAFMGATTPLAIAATVTGLAQGWGAIVWYPLLLVPPGLVGGFVLGAHRPAVAKA